MMISLSVFISGRGRYSHVQIGSNLGNALFKAGFLFRRSNDTITYYLFDQDVQKLVLLRKSMNKNSLFSSFLVVNRETFRINRQLSDFLEINTNIYVQTVRII